MRHTHALLATASLALGACTTAKVTSDFDETQNFTGYQTYAWAGESPMAVYGSRPVPPTLEPKVARAIEAELAAKGFRKADTLKEADFAVSFTIGTRDGTQITQTPDYFWVERQRWGWGYSFYPPGRLRASGTRTEVREYTEGSLSIDIYDVERRSPVWHGTGTKNLSSAELNGETSHVVEGVSRVLEGFPPS